MECLSGLFTAITTVIYYTGAGSRYGRN